MNKLEIVGKTTRRSFKKLGDDPTQKIKRKLALECLDGEKKISNRRKKYPITGKGTIPKKLNRLLEKVVMG